MLLLKNANPAMAATFPDDEPEFAKEPEAVVEEHSFAAPAVEDVVEETVATVEEKEPEEVHSYGDAEPETHKTPIEAAFEETVEESKMEDEPEEKVTAISEHPDHDSPAPVMGTMAEEEIEEEEADLAHYVEELEEDDFVEMEEEVTAADDHHHDDHAHEIAAVGEPCSETVVPFSADPISRGDAEVGETGRSRRRGRGRRRTGRSPGRSRSTA